MKTVWYLQILIIANKKEGSGKNIYTRSELSK